MVMDQFVTTYRKDYLWPYVRILGNKPKPEKLYEPQYRDPCEKVCPCHCLQPVSGSSQAVFGPNAVQEESWSRLGPMGPLLDPKLYPAKVGTSPETETQRFNQPNVFLKKLQDKYPFIYEVLRSAPPDDLISRINRDRLRTTYQVDFGKMNEYPSAPYDELLRSAGMEGLAPCSEPIRLPGDPCRPNQKPIAFRPATISNLKQFDVKGGDKGGLAPTLTPGASEYQDAISKLGAQIIRDKIHGSPKPPGRNVGNVQLITSYDGVFEEDKLKGKRKAKGIAGWNPFDKNEVEHDDITVRLGQMIYRDTMHSHGPRSSGRRRLRT